MFLSLSLPGEVKNKYQREKRKKEEKNRGREPIGFRVESSHHRHSGVYSRAQKNLDEFHRTGRQRQRRGGEEERKRERKTKRRTRREGTERMVERRGDGEEKRNKSKKQGGRRRQQSLVSRLIPLPPSHLIALSHATSKCVGVSGRLKKHGRLRPSIQKKTVESQDRIGEERKERKKERRRETERRAGGTRTA